MKKSGSKIKSKTSVPLKKEEDFQDNNLETLLNITNTSIWTLDKNYCLLYGNSTYYEECLVTFNKKIEVGETVLLNTLEKEDKIEWKNYYDRALNGEKFSIERKRKYHKKLKWRVYHFGPIKNKEEEIIGASVVANDITERILAEQSLLKSTKRFEEFVNMLPEAIFEMDENNNLTYANHKAFNLFGYSESDFSKGLDAFNMLIPEDREKAKINFQNRLKGDIPGTIEYTALKKDGTEFPILFHASSIFEEKKFKGTRGLIIDITERKKVEEKLRAHETFLNETQKIARLGTYKMDIASGNWESSEILDEIFGITENFEKNVEGWVTLIHPDWKEIMSDYLINEVIGNRALFNKEYQIIRKNDDEQRWVHGLGRLEYDDLGNPVTMIGTIQDITDVKKIQEELIKAKEKAEESDRLKSAFLANMSHEIRTPMNGILGFANLLKEPQLNGEEQKSYIEIIEKSGERMLNTINDIIDISKIESGQVKITNQEFSISKNFIDIFQFFKPEVDKKGILLVLKNELTKAEDKITSDEEKLNAILTNLVKNAIKFCDEGKIEIGCKRKDKSLVFYVKDSGKGIPSDRQQAIFDRFVQADIEDKDAHEGSGLGLAISKSYVELLGGKIWVESEKEKGSAFYFTIPYYPVITTEEIQSEKGFDNNKKIRKLNILIVEDDNVSEMLIRTMIDRFGKNIYTAKTGLEAIEICKLNPEIDLILMDIKMPFMDGYEATKKIREFNENVTIIATTAFALAGDMEKAIESGCNYYLSKPIMQDRLHGLIRQHFS